MIGAKWRARKCGSSATLHPSRQRVDALYSRLRLPAVRAAPKRARPIMTSITTVAMGSPLSTQLVTNPQPCERTDRPAELKSRGKDQFRPGGVESANRPSVSSPQRRGFQMLKHVFVLTVTASMVACGTAAAKDQTHCVQARTAQPTPPIKPPSGAPIPHPSSGGPVPTVQPPPGDAAIVPQSPSGHALTPQPLSGAIPTIRPLPSDPVAPFRPGSKQACISFRVTERVRPA